MKVTLHGIKSDFREVLFCVLPKNFEDIKNLILIGLITCNL
jgi:hypothetical protein